MPPATTPRTEALNVMTMSFVPVAGAVIYQISERIRPVASVTPVRGVMLCPAYVIVDTVGKGVLASKMFTPTTRILFVPLAPTVWETVRLVTSLALVLCPSDAASKAIAAWDTDVITRSIRVEKRTIRALRKIEFPPDFSGCSVRALLGELFWQGIFTIVIRIRCNKLSQHLILSDSYAKGVPNSAASFLY